MKKFLFPTAIIALIVVSITFTFYRGVMATHDAPPSAIFNNFATWTYTMGYESAAAPAITLLTKMSNFYSGQITPIKYTFSDINGDNLPDFLYHQQSTIFNTSPRFFAIFLNNGNNNFNLAYKCVFQKSSSSQYYSYGDCATTAPARDPNAPENQTMLSQVLQLTKYYSSSSPTELPAPLLHLWLDINGDGLQDYIDDCLYINSNQGGKSILSFQKICS